MSVAVKSGLRAGVIFGVTLVFSALIGFTTIASELIAETLLGADVPPGSGSVPGLLVFLGLVGLWAGAIGARPTEPDTLPRAAAAGLVAGLVAGLLLAALTLAAAWAQAAGFNLRTYLVQLSPQAIDLLLLGRPAPGGALLAAAWVGAAGLTGGLVARGIGRGVVGEWLRAGWRGARTTVAELPVSRRVRTESRARVLAQLCLMGVLLLIPLFAGQYWNYTMGTVGIYILMGLGLNIVVGLAGLLDLGYVAFFAVGAYTVGLLTSPEPLAWGLPFWLVLPAAVVVAALAGVLLGVPVLRLRGDYLAIVTLGFGEIIRILVKSDLMSDYLGGPQGVRDIAGPTLLGRPFDSERAFMYLILFGIMLVIFVTLRMQHSRVGRAWIAMREDETVARAMGIDVYRAKLLAFAIGAAFAGLGGALFSARNQYTGPEDHTLLVSINVLCVVVVGGMGSIPGVIVGAVALKGLPEVLRDLETYRYLFFGALLVVMMILRPEGLWPSKRRRLEMHAADAEAPTDGTIVSSLTD